MKFADHPLWLAGFRPFFALACLAGMSLPMIWALTFSGALPAPTGPFSMIQWHAHEMFFGFGWAVLGGFLLTATKNWVSIRGHHGRALIFLATAWFLERLGMAWAGSLPPWLFRLSNNLFLVSIVLMLLHTLIRHRAQDSYRDNYFFLLVLPAFLVAKQLLLAPETFAIGVGITLGLFRMAFLVMFERTLTQFMKSVFQVSILRHPLLDTAIKGLGLLLVLQPLLPPLVGATLALGLALLLTFRFCFWKPLLGLSRLDIGVMYLGYLAITAQLCLEFLQQVAPVAWVGSLSVHVFTFGAMGLVIPAMLIRIAKGHTGRKVVFEPLDKLALWFMILAFVVRILLPQIYPAGYTHWIHLAASCWLACFGLLGWRLIPFLLAPRVD
ncbi:MAG: NnrS family protein, partial [Betaproteobacteria bacterium]|nr:NnrS family protein [Betaproteobacteria bacterium]